MELWLIEITLQDPVSGKRRKQRTYVRGIGTFISLISLLVTLGIGMPSSAHAGIISDFLSFATSPVFAQSTGTTSDSGMVNTTPSANDSVLMPALNADPSPSSIETPTIADASLIPSANLSQATSTNGGSITLYTVHAGDSIGSIAALFGISPNTIMWANGLSKGSVIKTGQVLTIFPISGIPYTTKNGDTLSSIAKRFGADTTDIALFNGIDTGPIPVGTQIIIPNGEAPVQQDGSSDVKTSPNKHGGVVSIATHIGQYLIVRTGIEAAHDLGPIGTTDQIAYYAAPLSHYIKTQNIHGYNAVDLGAPEGTPVMAAAPGTVIIAKEGGYNGGYGSYVVISHANGSQTLYAHLSKVVAARGDTVARGDVIGAVGETGWATGPHLHFEIRNGILNPF